jgi:hypothetical protein
MASVLNSRPPGYSPLHGRPLDDNGGVAFRPLACRCTPCQWAGVHQECPAGCQPDTGPVPLDVTGLQHKLDAIIYDHGMTLGGKVDSVLLLIASEVKRAMTKWPPTTDSPHHHASVLREEVDEMWDEVKADNIRLAREEALQVAAMAIRFVLEADLAPSRRKPNESPMPRPNCPSCGSHPPYHRNGCGFSWLSGEPPRAVPTSSIPCDGKTGSEL